MDLNQVMGELDALFTQEKMSEIPQFLQKNIEQAKKEDARDILLTLYNECIGFYRETGDYEQSIENCTKAIALMDEMGLQGTIPYATTLLNAATAHRAAGLLQESLELYTKVRPIYVAQLKEDDPYFAGLYNNLSLLYQEMGNFEAAKEQLENALHIVSHKPDKQFEVAVTQANLANTCIELEQDDEAKARAEEAIRIFEKIGVDDAHYSAALSALGSLYFMDKDYQNALEVMEKSRDCVAKYLGADNIQYQRLSDNIKIIKGKMEEEQSAKITSKEQEQETTTEEDDEKSDQIQDEDNTSTDETSIEESDDKMIEEPVEAQEKSNLTEDTQKENKTNSLEQSQQDQIPTKNEQVTAEDVPQKMSKADTTQVEKGKEEEDKAVDAMIAEVMDEIAVEVEDAADIQQKPSDKSSVRDNTEKMMVEEAVDLKDIDQYFSDNTLSNAEGQEETQTPSDDTSSNTEGQEETQTSSDDTPSNTEEQKDQTVADIELAEQESLVPEIMGLELCRRYYEEYGKPMIAEKFQAYESVIAVGLVGKGSDCFGFDDIQSQDHDFGPRFMMWVTKKVYDEIGEELADAYEKLPRSFMGVERMETAHGKDRAGVMVIEDFYKNVLGFDLIGTLLQNNTEGDLEQENLATIKNWLAVHDYALAAAVNGEVFRDDEGIFTRYRKRLLKYYPKAVWYRKIANACALFSQNGQYNLPRMRKRGQFVAAELAKAECVKQAMKLFYLLSRQYAPHDKWLFKGMTQTSDMDVVDTGEQSVALLVEKISMLPVDRAHEADLATSIELLAVLFANELEKQNIIGKCDLYLDACTQELVTKSDALLTAIVAGTPVVTALSLSIAKAEFEAFDKVKNEGGRASCQNNWPTFKVMRMSQYMTWTEDMLLQYLYEFKDSYAKGRNMIEEKYARMMESTAPEEYAQFAHQLPPVSEEKKAIMEQIIELQVKWMEEFAQEYPNLAGNARIIHTAEDLPYDTSYETYLRGELGTYSDQMIELYGRYIVEHARNNKNVAREIMENTIHFYGYQDLETANEQEANVLGEISEKKEDGDLA